jgi:hypothetical protein
VIGSARLRSAIVHGLVMAVIAGGRLTAQSSDSAEVKGVVASPTRMTIADAEITVLGQSAKTTSDAVGKFRLGGIVPGEVVVRVRRIGFNAEYFKANLRSGDSKEVEIVMSPGAYELPEVNVIARNIKPIEYAWTTRFDDFFRRKIVGLGVYRDRAYIDRTNPLRTANLLAGIAGVRLRFRHPGPSGTDVEFMRCERVSVWIDGVKQRLPFLREPPSSPLTKSPNINAMAVSEMLEQVSPLQIEMMEVYRGPSEMPAEFIDDSCAAIAIWTR